MDTAAPANSQSPSEPHAIANAWPRSAQTATAFLSGIAVSLLAVHAYGYLRLGTRPSELERSAAAGYRIDLNRAETAELLQIPGVGDQLAERIQDYRQDHGRFRDVNDLMQVRGIGPTTLARFRPWLDVQDRPAAGRDAAPAIGNADADHARVPKLTSAGKEPLTRKASGSKEARLTHPIYVNKASADELQRLPGIGPKLSQRIVDERSKKPFGSVEELRRVSGIGPKLLERIRPYIRVDDQSLRVANSKPNGAVKSANPAPPLEE